MRVGVFVARMQPIHNSHMEIIKRACEENDSVHIFVSSAEKFGTDRNPFDYYTRNNLIKEALKELHYSMHMKVEVHELSDWTSEDDFNAVKEWGRYLYYNIVNKTHSHQFKLYYSDKPEIINEWFEPGLKERVEIVYLNREEIYNGLSATMIRNAFELEDIEFVKENCPKIVSERFYHLRVRELELRKLAQR